MPDNQKPKRIGLALGGGAARGVAHIGALKAFDDFRIKFDYITGTSVGSIIGAAYAAGVSWAEMLRFARSISTRDILQWKKWNLGYDPAAIGRLMIKIIGDCQIEELKIPYSAIAVDVRKGKEVVFSSGPVAEAVQASCCVPGVFIPVEYEDKLLVDGGVLNNVPANVVREMGSDIVIGIDLNSDYSTTAGNGGYFEVLYTVFNLMVRNKSLWGHRHADIIIEPDMKNIPYHHVRDIDNLVIRGETAARAVIPKIQELCR